MKILLVDDSKTMRRIQMNTLTQLGYDDIIQAENGKEALDVLAENLDVGLVLLDWNMPIMTGIDCLKNIKSAEAIKHIPVVMVTSEAEKTKIIEAVQAGASNYVVKPFEPEVLKEKIEAVLNK